MGLVGGLGGCVFFFGFWVFLRFSCSGREDSWGSLLCLIGRDALVCMSGISCKVDRWMERVQFYVFLGHNRIPGV